MKTSLDLSLYLIVDPILCGGIDGMVDTARQAVNNGVTLIQLRVSGEWKKRQWYEAAQMLKHALQPYQVPLIINDHLDIALAVDADGLHIGQKDLPPDIARYLLGHDKWLGLSVSNQQQLHNVPLEWVDYIGIGPIFPTRSKTDADPALGISELNELVQKKRCPAVAIGGITVDNIMDVMATGIDGIAVISAICGQANPAAASQQLHQLQSAAIKKY